MATRVVVLGAGASFGHGNSGELCPPLAHQFFCHPLSRQLDERYEALFAFIARALGISREALQGIDIEDLIQELDPVCQLGSDTEWIGARTTVTPMHFLQSYMVDVLVGSTAWLKRATCPLHSQLAELLVQTGEAAISFNYDLLLDVAIEKFCIESMESTYGFGDHPGSADFRRKSMRLYKPHGSLNFKKEQYSVSEVSPIYTSESRSSPLRLEMKSRLTFDNPLGWINSIGNWPRALATSIVDGVSGPNGSSDLDATLTVRMMDYELFGSYLVLPSPYKPFERMRFDGLRRIWIGMADAIANCDELVVIGFSFRDLHFASFVASQIRRRSKRIRVSVFDPSESTFAHIRSVLDAQCFEVVHVGLGLWDFLSRE